MPTPSQSPYTTGEFAPLPESPYPAARPYPSAHTPLGEFAPLPPDLPDELVQTITCLLQPNPADRPSVAELLNLPAVRCRLQDWPYPVMLDTPSHSPTRLAPLSRAALEARPAAAGAAEAEAAAAAAAGFGGPGTLVPRGTFVWAKHGSDGLRRRMVRRAILAAAEGRHTALKAPSRLRTAPPHGPRSRARAAWDLQYRPGASQSRHPRRRSRC